MRLNLGCSDDLRGGEWMNVDISQGPKDLLGNIRYQFADLSLPWPWVDSSVEEIYAADIAEHVGDCPHFGPWWCERCAGVRGPMEFTGRPARHWSGRIHFTNEAYRILKPGGILRMECPDAAKGAGQFQDPTHVSPWTPNGLQYFADGSPAHKRFAQAYGITARFNIIGVTERMYREFAGDPQTHGVMCDVWKFSAVMEAVKP